MRDITVLTVLVVPFALVAVAPAVADFTVPDGLNYPWTRGATANSAYAEWDRFTSPTGPSAPDVGQFDTGLGLGAPAWDVYDTSGTSFITGGGNIYSFSAPTNIHAVIPGYDLGGSHATTVLFQLRTQGTEVDPASVNIGGILPVETAELHRESLGGFGGYLVDTLFRFELTGSALSYGLRFDALESSMSTDRVAIDTFTTLVPAPGAGALAGLGLLTAARRRR